MTETLQSEPVISPTSTETLGAMDIDGPSPSEKVSFDKKLLDPESNESLKGIDIKELLRKEIISIWNDTHPKLVQQRKLLLKKCEEKLLLAEIWKNYQISVVEKLYENEKLAAEKDFENQKNQLRNKMINDLLEKKKKWIEDQDWQTLSVAHDASLAQETRSLRKLRRRNGNTTTEKGTSANDSKEKQASSGINSKVKKAPSGPSIIFTLKEYEIDDDLDSIRQKKGGGAAVLNTRRSKYIKISTSKSAATEPEDNAEMDGSIEEEQKGNFEEPRNKVQKSITSIEGDQQEESANASETGHEAEFSSKETDEKINVQTGPTGNANTKKKKRY